MQLEDILGFFSLSLSHRRLLLLISFHAVQDLSHGPALLQLFRQKVLRLCGGHLSLDTMPSTWNDHLYHGANSDHLARPRDGVR